VEVGKAMKCHSSLAVVLFSLVAVSPAAADDKLLLGFEETEITTWIAALKTTRQELKTKDGVSYISIKSAFGGYDSWNIYKGKASQGEYALGLSLVRTGDDLPFDFKVPAEPQRHFGVFRDNWGQGAFLNTCGTFRRLLPIDWSAHDLLRLDVFCEQAAHTIRVQLEDEEIAPPIVRNMVVAPGKWTTLEVDLRSAEKSRRLDLKRMATLVVAVVKVDGKTTKTPSAFLDNVRLCAAKSPTSLPVVRDDTPLDLPDYYKASGRPQRERLPEGQPDRARLAREKPFVIPMKEPLAVTPVGWAAAYDNRHLLVGFCDSTDAFVLQSRDAGQSWRGLDGGAQPTRVPTRVARGCIDHQAGRGDVVGQRADVLMLSNAGCNGMVLSSLRWFSQKLTFTGKGWELEKTPALVDCDLRHCSSNQSVVRTADGRLWCAYGLVGRLGTIHINVRYSDDDGATWKASREGTSGVIPGSIGPDKDGVGFGYTHEEPCLVPFGSGVACIWEEIALRAQGKLRWARFDGTRWSAIEEIEAPARAGLVWCRPQLHAVSLGGKEIFLASGFRKGVLHYREGKWQKEPIEVPFGGRLSVAGDKSVLVIAARSETTDPRKGPMVIEAWERRADGRWSERRELAREEQPLTGMEGLNELRPGLVVQAYAPPNFVPIAWSCKGQKWIKYLRVPVGED
jgi:hypothetical protein